jgi:hypothetical protein
METVSSFQENDLKFIREVFNKSGIILSEPLNVEEIRLDEGSAAVTRKLYRIKHSNRSYILKELEEIIPAKHCQDVHKVSEFFKKNALKPSAPQLILSLFTGSIVIDRETKYFDLQPEAAGKSLSSLMNAFLSGEIDLDLVHCFSQIGSTIGSLNLQGATNHELISFNDFKSHYIHPDLHDENIFYEESSGTISLIDLDLMSQALDQPSSVENQLKTILRQSMRVFILLLNDDGPGHASQKKQIEAATSEFLRSYAKCFEHGTDVSRVLKRIVAEVLDSAYLSMKNKGVPIIHESEKHSLIERLFMPS